MSSNQKLFVLSNGSALRFRLLKDTGNQHSWWRSNDGPSFRRFLSKSKKLHLPMLGLWNSKTELCVVAADFDCLPKGYGDFPSFIQDLELQLGERAIATASASGRAKAFFVVRCPPGLTMKPAVALSTLQANLSEPLFAIIDRSPASLQQTYITPSMSDALCTRLPLCAPVPAVVPKEDLLEEAHLALRGASSVTICSTPSAEPSFGYFKGSLLRYPVIRRFADRSEKKALFIRTLILVRRLIEDGYDLPVEFFAEVVGVSPQAISSYVHELVKLKLLGLVDGYRWKIAPKAKTYRAIGSLAKLIARKSTCREEISLPLPSAIAPGQWRRTLFRVKKQYYRNDPEGYMRWFYSLPGWDDEDRRRNALNNVEQAHGEHVRNLMELIKVVCQEGSV